MEKYSTRAKGRRGEDIAIEYLKSLGYKIVEKNYRNNFGEVDIIANERGIVVFIEVKSANRPGHDSPAAAVDLRKQARLGRVAAAYIVKKKLEGRMMRFDVVTVTGDKAEVIEDAFDLQENFLW